MPRMDPVDKRTTLGRAESGIYGAPSGHQRRFRGGQNLPNVSHDDQFNDVYRRPNKDEWQQQNKTKWTGTYKKE